MARPGSSFVCQACGARTRQFFGRCAGCGGWNTLVEQSEPSGDTRRRRPVAAAAAPG
ncbi:DNA repair protein RadA, partial [Synechococcus sp. BA-120 BA3]|nr:DNA repair protein RadA [Synechococcus sp. BA-120 BA3]